MARLLPSCLVVLTGALCLLAAGCTAHRGSAGGQALSPGEAAVFRAGPAVVGASRRIISEVSLSQQTTVTVDGAPLQEQRAFSRTRKERTERLAVVGTRRRMVEVEYGPVWVERWTAEDTATPSREASPVEGHLYRVEWTAGGATAVRDASGRPARPAEADSVAEDLSWLDEGLPHLPRLLAGRTLRRDQPLALGPADATALLGGGSAAWRILDAELRFVGRGPCGQQECAVLEGMVRFDLGGAMATQETGEGRLRLLLSEDPAALHRAELHLPLALSGSSSELGLTMAYEVDVEIESITTVDHLAPRVEVPPPGLVLGEGRPGPEHQDEDEGGE